MENTTQIKCPNCGHEIDVQNLLTSKLEAEIKQKYHTILEVEKSKLEKQQEDLKKAQNEFSDLLEKKLKEEKASMEKQIKQKLQDEQSEQYKALQEELNEKSEKLRDLNRAKAEVEILKREKAELKETLEADAQKRLNDTIAEERVKIKRAEEDKNELRIKELQKQLDDQRKLTEEMKRKQEQGSMQLQGEVQELAIEEWLTDNFPLDTIDEVKKGANGGDCVQIVNTRERQNCGKIYYESKRTSRYETKWIDKFKDDMRSKGANIGVLVTEAMPIGQKRMALIDGIWVCSYEEFKGLCAVLRENLITVSMALASQENKGDKMHMLYDYLTSNEFRQQVEAIVEGFSSMKTALDVEKRSMQKIWKEREKQIEKVITSTVEMYGSVRGIAGTAVQTVRALELPTEDGEDGQVLI